MTLETLLSPLTSKLTTVKRTARFILTLILLPLLVMDWIGLAYSLGVILSLILVIYSIVVYDLSGIVVFGMCSLLSLFYLDNRMLSLALTALQNGIDSEQKNQ